MFETLLASLIIGKLIIEKTVRIMSGYSMVEHIDYLSLLESSGINTEKTWMSFFVFHASTHQKTLCGE